MPCQCHSLHIQLACSQIPARSPVKWLKWNLVGSPTETCTQEHSLMMMACSPLHNGQGCLQMVCIDECAPFCECVQTLPQESIAELVVNTKSAQVTWLLATQCSHAQHTRCTAMLELASSLCTAGQRCDI